MDEFATPRAVEVEPTNNLNDLLAARVAADPSAVMIERRVGDVTSGPWVPLTAAEFAAEVTAVAKGLVAHGIEPGARVGIMSRTRYEWTLLDWASWAAGAVPVPIYETSSAEQVEWIVTDSAVELLITETAEHAATVEEVRAGAPGLRTVLTLDDGAIDTLVASGTDVPDAEIDRRRAIADLSDVATLIYTSGTTGTPKGARMTHGNFYLLTVNAVHAVPEVFSEPGGRTLLFMPLAHVFARFIGVLVVAGGTVLAHTPDTTKLLDDLASFRPTYILSVPRVFEKVYNSSEQKAAAGGKLKIFHWASATAIAWSRALDDPKGPGVWLGLKHKIADKLVYSKLRTALGGNARWAVSGGGPLGERLGHFYRGNGLTILEGYGLTETTAPTSVNTPTAIKVGSVGKQLPGCAARLDEDGEILLKGDHVFDGYHNNPAETENAFTDGWFRTGDLGSFDAEGYLTITGRKKEIIVTAGGKNVAPALLEDRIRAHALVSQCVVVGDQRPFIGALITLDPEGLPGWCKMHGKPELSVEQAKDDEDVRAALDEAVARANKAVSRAESIRKYSVLDTDFTIENDYLTPSMKVKRKLVTQDFSANIDELYGTVGTGR
ncbi:long-chain-fatty-acid--CoA ligase [Paraoerskovia sediminicola]|uniref:Acyl-CoA synthetase n=1 Tax=Paraoerskovia sediminicola TaxID=1138587 RepID=A0ABN6XEQ9_9CELL|nr:AMP-dependent synthetase/ligase [Paraoerskovia sediminicola]BDZ43331.1 long-chain-fatty-acid--CoA ligase [Paraoerskovia sediminicola]